MNAAVEALALGKRFGRNWALRDCSFAIPAGSIGGLVGHNGAGKTTLLHLATGLLRSSTGEIKVLGRSPREDPGLLLDRVGFMAQDAPLYQSFTVADMLHFGRTLNRRWDQAGAEARLAPLNIPFNRRIANLSGGQRSQVALALALGKRPDLLLLDEPVARLDPLARRELLQSLTEAVADDGVSVLLSSHLVSDLERVCDYLVILTDGRVQVAGTIDTLLANHHLLVGPHLAEGKTFPGVDVVRVQQSERQTWTWIRGKVRHLPPGWREEPLGLEELVIAYLAAKQSTSLPEPELVRAGSCSG